MAPRIGFEKLAFAPRLTGAALGAGLGALAAPEEQGWTGAALGGALGYGGGALLGRAVDFARGAPRVAPTATPDPRAADIAKHMPDVDAFLSGKELSDQIAALQQPVPQHAPHQDAVSAPRPHGTPAPTAAPHGPQTGARNFRGIRFSAPVTRVPGTMPLTVPRRQFKLGFAKLADFGFSVGLPGVGISTSGKDERLPGMSKWVPRSTVEDAFQGLERGYDERALLEQAADKGSLRDPALGAAIGAGASHYFYPGAHPHFKALAALLGAGAGAVYNQFTTPDRVENMRQAIRGVSQERAGQDSAREAMPLVLSSASHI